MKFYLLVAISTVVWNGQVWAQLNGAILNPKFDRMLRGLLSHRTLQMSCADLYGQETNFILLDAREKEEYEISHIQGAIWVGYKNIDWNTINRIPKDKKIVCYCSVGYRSEKLTEKLQALGYKEVYNLYGSIFEWANRNYPLVDKNNARTNKLHAYNRFWGRWIDNRNVEKKY